MVASVARDGSKKNFPLSQPSIKLLDLLTNRYHTGIIESAWDQGLRVELPATARFHAGQRVRFVVATGETLVSKGSMRRALISDVDPACNSTHMSVELALLPDPAAD